MIYNNHIFLNDEFSEICGFSFCATNSLRFPSFPVDKTRGFGIIIICVFIMNEETNLTHNI